jgi:uncharacterized membrane protein
MIEVRAQLTIDRPVDQVWSYAAEIARHPEWMTVTSAECLPGTGSQIGDRGRERIRFRSWASNAGLTVVAPDPGRRIAWRPGKGPPFTGDRASVLIGNHKNMPLARHATQTKDRERA